MNKLTLILILAAILIIAIVVIFAVVFSTRRHKIEKFTQGSTSDSPTVTINGHVIDCTPEINYMRDYIKTSQNLA